MATESDIPDPEMLKLESARRATQAMQQQQTQFLADLGHSIRTPLNAVAGMTHLLSTTDLTVEQSDYTRAIMSSCESLTALISQLLEVSRLESGTFEIEADEFSLRETVALVTRSLASSVYEKGVELVVNFATSVPDRLVGDAFRLRQLLMTLMSNAVQATQSSNDVVVRIDVDKPITSQCQLHLSVRDSGPGLTEDKLKAVFEPFEQLGRWQDTDSNNGPGLGLYLTKRVVEAMSGELWCDSQIGFGSTFHVALPFQVAATTIDFQLDTAHSALGGKQVLLVDDNSASQQTLQQMLEHWGAEVVCAKDARTAIQRVTTLGDGASFDIAVIDAEMSVVDGYGLARLLKQHHANRIQRIALMLCSTDRVAEIKQCEEIGINGWIPKPIVEHELFDLLLEVSEGNTARRQPSVSKNRRQSLNLLLVEDSLFNQKLTVGILGKRGHEVTVVNNGREALKLLDQSSFDCVLMDLRVPELDGLQATRIIRQREQKKQTRQHIIALTADAIEGDKQRCIDAGMDDYLAKPFRPDELIAKIESICDSNSSHDVSAMQLPPDGRGRVKWHAALEACGRDPSLLIAVIEAFLEDYESLHNSMLTAIKTHDPDLLAQTAHSVKSAVRLFGDQKLIADYEVLERIDDTIDFRQSLPKYQSARDGIDEIVGELSAFMATR